MRVKVPFFGREGRGTRHTLLGRHFVLGILPTVLFLWNSPASAEVAVPENARTMTGVELYMIFQGKTWTWESGAGRMESEDRAFRAWAQSATGESWAEGRWSVNDRGQLCLMAVWHSQSAAAPDKTCFSHRTLDGTIYQKREPSGDWYVFKHAEAQTGDEFNRLVREDLVAAKLAAVKERLEGQVKETKNSVRRKAGMNAVGGVQ
ncbi:DUF995 domain-containing protein [Sinorhizobium meliloti]|jgi:hypothetical protein|uniref:DUF995 domain-containing protein n=1 Tax=Rhizobium meliloti TaxID=382 RepID=UPI000381869E|nr:DUF995 domain-containing protein [Sinorhizobium meliloti]TWB05755.1 uncharacterized protein DUF995 [Ensifer sp. SEMIA 134]TWB40221.1 uncharacterized protein DUF995 [Ensifer sp. SEMIA 135]AIM03601.1 hypothetical protein DU99_31025 [Sinorhizobium meliloti]MCK3786026.1 DUF995 domain-containing protein [Sinorhizobium meliloti]MCK3792309.1 DUF995 domain-containing protein [Sinorhizobium meliloti]